MPWTTVAQLIAQYGIPFTEYLINLIRNSGGPAPTVAEWAQLKSMANVTSEDEMTKVLSLNGIDPASEQGKAFLALVK